MILELRGLMLKIKYPMGSNNESEILTPFRKVFRFLFYNNFVINAFYASHDKK